MKDVMSKLGRWSLRELLDFEWLLRTEPARAEGTERSLYRREVRDQVADVRDAVDRRQKGLLAWFRARESAAGDALLEKAPGRNVTAALSLAKTVAIVVLFVSGSSLVWGLIERPEGLLNLGTFLAAALGVQLLILLAGVLALIFRRRISATFSFLGSLLLGVVFFATRGRGRESWEGLVNGSARYRKVALWKLMEIGQAGAVAFNVGLLLGLLSAFLVLDVRVYWETTADGEPEVVVHKLVQGLGAPVVAVAPRWVPDEGAVRAIRKRAGEPFGAASSEYGVLWPSFVLLVVAIWGWLPRLLLWAVAKVGVRKALGTLDFQAAAHRELWRKMSYVERVVETEGQMDEAVVIDCGGAGLELGDIAGFIRARLRLFPVAIHQTGVISEQREDTAREALEKARSGVVMMVEGWDLSPKLVQSRHAQLRALIGAEKTIWYVIHNDGVGDVSAEQISHWKGVIDAIEDAAADVIAYEEVHFAKEEQA